MDVPHEHMDEVVADSEEEDLYLQLDEPSRNPGGGSFITSIIGTVVRPRHAQQTSISVLMEQAGPPRPEPSSAMSNIEPNTPVPGSARPKPRPRPRPKMIKLKEGTSSSVIETDSVREKPSSIQLDSSGFLGPELKDKPSSIEEMYIMDIAERAKMRSRNAKSSRAFISSTASESSSRSRRSGCSLTPPIDMIELTSDEDEIQLKSPPKSSRTKSDSLASTPSAALPASPHSTSQTPFPVHISSNPVSGHNTSSSPKPLTPPSAGVEHPPIAVLSVADSSHEYELDTSDESLFSPRPSKKRKRSKKEEPTDVLPRHRNPPPTFFTSSSPPVAETEIHGVRTIETEMPVTNASQSEQLAKSTLSKKSPAKKTKTKDHSSEERKKGKSKAKSTGKKGKGKKGTTQFEVVIDDSPVMMPGKEDKDKENPSSTAMPIDVESQPPELSASVGTSITENLVPSRQSQPEQFPDPMTVPLSDLSDLENSPIIGRKRKSVDKPPVTRKKKSTRVPKKKSQSCAASKTQSKCKAIMSDDEDEFAADKDDAVDFNEASKHEAEANTSTGPPSKGVSDKGTVTNSSSATKENCQPDQQAVNALVPKTVSSNDILPKLSSRYSIAPHTKSTPMSELIRRVNSLPGSPFPATTPRGPSTSQAYSPYLKSSRSFLSRIAPLHPNRREPPPPLPPPPPPKKTRKEREREEKWEEELIESVGGITEWACLTDAERKEMRRAKWEMEMGGWED